MSNQTCPVCQSPMRWVEAGVSRKTGKPYQGFWSCPNRCPKQPTPKSNGFEANMAKKAEYIEQAQNHKDSSMKVLNSKNIAGDIIVVLLDKGLIKPEEFKAKFQEYSSFIYNFTPSENNLGFNPDEIF